MRCLNNSFPLFLLEERDYRKRGIKRERWYPDWEKAGFPARVIPSPQLQY